MLRHFRVFAVAALAIAALAAPAAASDAVQAAVTFPAGQPLPVTSEHGIGYTPGTFARGTIVLDYVVVAEAFPAGPFASFNLDLAVQQGTNGAAPAYPVPLTLSDIGSPHVNMTASVNPITVENASWTGSTLVTINIPSSVASDPAFSVDGAQIVGNLQLDTPSGSHLDTVTTIKVRITLAKSDSACIRFYNFITDADIVNVLTSTEVNVNKKKGTVTATNPGQFSDNLLVVNTCGTTETFDLKIRLDDLFTTNPSGNSGNAVFTFTTAGVYDPSTFLISAFGTGTPHGQTMCVADVSLPASSSFLAAVHMGIVDGLLTSQLPGSGSFSGFGGELHEAGFACGGALHAGVAPNPVSASLTFTVK